MEENKILRSGLCLVGLVLGMAVCWQLFGGSGDSGGDGNAVNRTMDAIEADNLRASDAVRDAGGAIDRGQRELEEVIGRIDDCETILEESTKRADRRKAILEDCRQNISRAEQIIAEVERRNKAGEENP